MYFSSSFIRAALIILVSLSLSRSFSNAQLTPSFYDRTCPSVFDIVHKTILQELRSDPRITASLLRLHFHDCFVRGCDASLLLDTTPQFRSEKEGLANINSARGFDVIDRMKASIERNCPGVVSCADILAISAERSVSLAGGPSYKVLLGRRDSFQGFIEIADTALPPPFFTFRQLKDNFAAAGLNRPSDLAALSGAHTFGKAQCQVILDRLYNFSNTGQPDPALKKSYLKELRKLCPQNGNASFLLDFDPSTPTKFDNDYYSNLKKRKGLLQSDQEIFSSPGADTIPLVELYSKDQSAFFKAFVESIIRMGNIKPLTGNDGEIRLNCRVVNSKLKGVEDNNGFVSAI